MHRLTVRATRPAAEITRERQARSPIHSETVSAIAISCATSARDGKPSMQNHVSCPVRAVCPPAHSARSRCDLNGIASGCFAEEHSRHTITQPLPVKRPRPSRRGPFRSSAATCVSLPMTPARLPVARHYARSRLAAERRNVEATLERARQTE
jgi:hypothetical protein